MCLVQCSSICLIAFATGKFPAEQLGLLAVWLDKEPTVPVGRWFKQFPGMISCGEGDLIKTFLRIGQVPTGEEVP